MTRQEYLADRSPDAHQKYYGQFVTKSILSTVSIRIGKQRILDSKDPHFNDIPLKEWDALPATKSMVDKMAECKDFLTLSGKVCIYKEAARQIRDSQAIR